MTEIPKVKSFYEMCEALASKRASGTMPQEQIEAMDNFRKSLSPQYLPKTAKEVAEIRNFAPNSKIVQTTDDSFLKATQED